MERYIKTNVNDITYQSELIPAALLRKAKQRGLIRPNNTLPSSAKYCGLIKLCRQEG